MLLLWWTVRMGLTVAVVIGTGDDANDIVNIGDILAILILMEWILLLLFVLLSELTLLTLPMLVIVQRVLLL